METKAKKPVEKTVRLVLRTILHAGFGLTHYSVSLFGLWVVLSMTEEQIKIKDILALKNYTAFFFTNWNLLFQTVFLTLSLICDVLEWMDKHESRIATKLRYHRDVIFSGLVFPYTLFISGMFWSIFLIDRELVFPEVYDQVVPWWFNHCVHTNIIIVVILETFIQPRRYPADRNVELILDGVVGISYAVVYYSIYFFAHRWLYAVFGVFNWWQVCLYQLMIWASCFIFYFIQFPINRLFHKEDAQNIPVLCTEEVPGSEKNGIKKKTQENLDEVNLKCSTKQYDNSSL